DSVAPVLAAEGRDLGVTDWIGIDQRRIDTFADATGDHQWIHVHPQRAKDGPFGACVAHGYLTLALANLFLPQLVRYERLKMGVNYGCDKVRFPAPVLGGHVIRSALAKVGVDGAEVDDVILGVAAQQGTQGYNLGRLCTYTAGLPDSVGGMTIDRMCASGLMSIATAAKAIAAGEYT